MAYLDIENMKIRIFHSIGLALALGLGPLLSGCNEQANSAPVTDISTNSVSSQAPPPGAPAMDSTQADSNQPSGDEQSLADAPGQIISTPDTAPATSNNPQLNEVAKLARAGVGESILLAYVTNSPNAFNMSSDDIVYLNDLGVPESVVNAMMSHDQTINGGMAQAQPPAMSQPEQGYATPQPATEAPPVPDQNAMAQGAPSADEAVTPPLTPSPDAVNDAQDSPNGAYSYFYDSLSPYGNWVNIQGYGPCWQPTAVAANPGWSPYSDRGHWAYTDCGWCWVSDYSWGWAPFHYGRWFHHNRWGWCWAPDTVWGPAWVSWRYNTGFCGWAPLPPAACYRPGFGFTYFGRSVGFNFAFGLSSQSFVFVPLDHFHDRGLNHFRLNHREVSRIFNSTTLNNQIIHGNNNMLINRGVPVERVAAATHTEIRPIRIRADESGPRSAQLGRDGRSLSVYRPALPAPKAGVLPRMVGEGVPPSRNFDLRTQMERPMNTGVRGQFGHVDNPTAAERRSVVSTPNAAPRNDVRQDNRPGEVRNYTQPGYSQPNNGRTDSPMWRSTPGNVENNNNVQYYARSSPSNNRHGQVYQPRTPAPSIQNPGNSMPQENEQRRSVPDQRWQSREFPQQPATPAPRQEAPRYYEQQQQQPRVNRDYSPPSRSAPDTSRNFESRSSAPVESAPSAPSNRGGGGSGGGGNSGGGWGGGGNSNQGNQNNSGGGGGGGGHGH